MIGEIFLAICVGGFSGLVAGKFMQRREIKGARRKAGQPICGCKHHVSYHKLRDDGKLGDCRHTTTGGLNICTCMHYVGPEPLPEYYG